MAYLDINPEETEFTTVNGAFKLVDRAAAIAGNVIISNPGDIKYAPTVGGGAVSFLNSSTQKSAIQRAFKVALQSAGFSRPVVDVSSFPNIVRVNNDEVLTFNG